MSSRSSGACIILRCNLAPTNRKLQAESPTKMAVRPALTGVESCCSNSRHHPLQRWSIKLEFSPLAQLRLICEEMPNPLDPTGSTILDKTPSSWRAIRLDKLHIDSSANSAVRIQPVSQLATPTEAFEREG